MRTMLSEWLKNFMASVYKGKSRRCCKKYENSITGLYRVRRAQYLVVEEVYCVSVELEGKSFEK